MTGTAQDQSRSVPDLHITPTSCTHFHAESADELVAASLAGWPSMLDDFKPHLHQRWNEGCTNIQQLHREVRALGFRGSYATVYAYLAPFQGKAAPPAVPGPPKVRHITSWIRRRPDNLDAGEQLKLKQVRAACPHLDALRGHVEEFAKMLTGRRGERLDAWIAAVRAGDLPHLHTLSSLPALSSATGRRSSSTATCARARPRRRVNAETGR